MANTLTSVESDSNCASLLKIKIAGCIHHKDIQDVTYEHVVAWRKCLPNYVVVVSGAGSPCQDLTALQDNPKGLSGDRSRLFMDAVRIHSDVGLIYRDVPVLDFIENVASMTNYWAGAMSKLLQRKPWRLCPSGISRVKISWSSGSRLISTRLISNVLFVCIIVFIFTMISR